MRKPVYTTREAFEFVIYQKGIHQTLGMTVTAVLNMRRRFKGGRVSDKKIDEVLKKAGFVVAQEKLWELGG